MSGLIVGREGEDVHISEQAMQRYVEHRLSQQEREPIDRHLAECDSCLLRFMDAVEAAEAGGGLPSSHTPPDMDMLEQHVIAQLYAEEEARKPEAVKETQVAAAARAPVKAAQSSPRPVRRRSWLQNPVAQYTIAASITLLLVGTGTFAGLSEKLSKLDQGTVSQPPQATEQLPALPSESWSDRMVDRTGSWLDGIRKSRYK